MIKKIILAIIAWFSLGVFIVMLVASAVGHTMHGFSVFSPGRNLTIFIHPRGVQVAYNRAVRPTQGVIVGRSYVWGGFSYRPSTNDVAPVTFNMPRTSVGFELRAPAWAILIILSIYPALLIWKRPIRRDYRRLLGQCTTCGYDLRASPDRCPECGTEVKG